MTETSYINNGEVYKINRDTFSADNSFYQGKNGSITSRYYPRSTIDNSIFPFFSVKTNEETGDVVIKTYHKTEYYCSKEGGDSWYDITNIDVSPEIKEPQCVAIKEAETELFFNVGSLDTMYKISDYYSLPPPLDNTSDFDTNPIKWRHCRRGSVATSTEIRNSKLCSIKFIDSLPILYKAYRYESN